MKRLAGGLGITIVVAILATSATPASAATRGPVKIPVGADGTVSRSTALKVFDATLAPLPGVKSRKGGYRLHSGTGAIRWLTPHLARLPARQRRAVQRQLKPSSKARAATTTSQALAVALQARDRINAKVDPDITIPIAVQFDTTEDGNVESYAETTVIGEDSAPTCLVTVTPVGEKLSAKELRVAMLHEMAHCIQWQYAPTSQPPPFVDEGGPQWLSMVLGAEWNKSPSTIIGEWWSAYFATFTTPLFQRTYDAQGFYNQLAAGGANLYAALPALFVNPKSAAEAYDTLVNAGTGPGAAFLKTTASAGMRRAELGAAWETTGPSLPKASAARYKAPEREVSPGVTLTLKAGAYTNAAAKVKASGPAVQLVNSTPDSAYGLLHASDGDHELGTSEPYCTQEECTCPSGKELPRLGDDAYLTLWGHKAEAEVQLQPISFADACKSPTNMRVNGAWFAQFTQEGFCGGGHAMFYELNIGQVILYLDTGGILVTKFGDPGGEWSNPKGGGFTVDKSEPGGLSGTVDATLESPKRFDDDPTTTIQLSGTWTCTTSSPFGGGS